MKVLLTGASGFIGKHVFNHLDKHKYDVTCVSRKSPVSPIWMQFDILDSEATLNAIQEVKPDFLIHLAWDVEHGVFWNNLNNEKYMQATINLFKAFISQGGKKIIAAGSCAEYNTSSVAVAEDVVVNKKELSHYGKAKREVYEWLESNVDTFSWLRIFGIYGNGENERRLIPYLVKSLKNNTSINIRDKNFYTDYIYVEDFAKLVSCLLTNRSEGCLNIGTGVPISNLKIYETLCKYFDYQVPEAYEVPEPSLKSRIPNCEKLINFGYDFQLKRRFSEVLK